MSRIAQGPGARLLRQLAQGAVASGSRSAAALPRAHVSARAAVVRPVHNFLLATRSFACSPQTRREDSQSAAGSATPPAAPSNGTAQAPLGEIKPRLSLTFTCTASGCGHRSTHEFSKQAYTRGIVIVQCPGCQNRHLIADHLGWFTETADEPKTVEEMVAAKGGQVKRGFKYSDGRGGHAIEIEPDEDAPAR
ncbi:hypothetical protein OC834_001868 [Tilletia horrida]|nr:hypothetical protein OC834_001868 [Tilletia horrida]